MFKGERLDKTVDVVGDVGGDVGEPIFWTFAMVENALIEAHDLWRRSPRVGHRPLKSCWPEFRVHQVGFGEGAAFGVADVDGIVPEPRPLPLSRAEVAKRDRVSEWVALVPGEMNRRIVWRATAQLASGRSQVDWRRVRNQLRLINGRGSEGRYTRAIGAICAALNNPDAAAMIAGGAGPNVVAEALGLTFLDAYGLVRQLRG